MFSVPLGMHSVDKFIVILIVFTEFLLIRFKIVMVPNGWKVLKRWLDITQNLVDCAGYVLSRFPDILRGYIPHIMARIVSTPYHEFRL